MNNLEQGFELVQQFISPVEVKTFIDEITAAHDQKSMYDLGVEEAIF